MSKWRQEKSRFVGFCLRIDRFCLLDVNMHQEVFDLPTYPSVLADCDCAIMQEHAFPCFVRFELAPKAIETFEIFPHIKANVFCTNDTEADFELFIRTR